MYRDSVPNTPSRRPPGVAGGADSPEFRQSQAAAAPDLGGGYVPQGDSASMYPPIRGADPRHPLWRGYRQTMDPDARDRAVEQSQQGS